VESWLNALQKIISRCYCRTTGLSVEDPPELWQYAIGHSEPVATPPPEIVVPKPSKQAIGHSDESLVWDAYKEFRTDLGSPTLGETVRKLAERLDDDALLASHNSQALENLRARAIHQGRLRLQPCRFLFRCTEKAEVWEGFVQGE
jgi:hypothetical protein